MSTSQSNSQHASARAFTIEAAQLLAGRHCEDICIIDVRGLSQVCDFVVIATGTSDRQMRSVAHELEDLGKELNHPVFRSSADGDATWIVCDFVDVVVHLFEPARREYYDLETLWSDGPRIDWEKEVAVDA